jgi:hypothetical protein
MVHITEENMLDTLRGIIEERGENYVYEGSDESDSCLYVHQVNGDLVPGCLVGTALHRLGVPLQTMTWHEGASAHGLLRRLTKIGVIEGGADHIAFALNEAQAYQDKGSSWGYALRIYERRMHELKFEENHEPE